MFSVYFDIIAVVSTSSDAVVSTDSTTVFLILLVPELVVIAVPELVEGTDVEGAPYCV